MNGCHMNSVEAEYLFPPSVLESLDFTMCECQFNPEISILKPGDGLKMRPLKIDDFNHGYLELLSQLTTVGEVSEEKFKETFLEMYSCKNKYYIMVIEEMTTNQVIGSATMLIEKKFIHSAGLRARLEDVVINDAYRGRQLGKLIVETVKLLAQDLGCYKLTLDCKDALIKFYNQLGFICEKGNCNTMTIRYKK